MLDEAADQLAELLAERQLRVAFAESCTAGLVSATLARVPGISQWLCGSAVTYREATKQHWLDVPRSLIEQHTAESERVTREMAVNVLNITPEADFAAAVTGHLGPGAPSEVDGVVFIAIGRRESAAQATTATNRFTLRSQSRSQRQEEAAALVLDQLRTAIE